MKIKSMKKVISLLLPILTLFILSACNNNRVDRDLAKTAISNIRYVVEAAGLEAEGYSTEDTFHYAGYPNYVNGTRLFLMSMWILKKIMLRKLQSLNTIQDLKKLKRKFSLVFPRKQSIV